MKSSPNFLKVFAVAMALCASILTAGCGSGDPTVRELKDRLNGLYGTYSIDYTFAGGAAADPDQIRGTIADRGGEKIPFCVVIASGGPAPAACKKMSLHKGCDGIDVYLDLKVDLVNVSESERREALKIPNALSEAIFTPQGFGECTS